MALIMPETLCQFIHILNNFNRPTVYSRAGQQRHRLAEIKSSSTIHLIYQKLGIFCVQLIPHNEASDIVFAAPDCRNFFGRGMIFLALKEKISYGT